MRKKKKIYEGKAKKLYETDEPSQLIQEFKDDITVGDGDQQVVIKGKGIINNQISAFLFEYLEGFHVPTHYLNTFSNRDMLIKRLEMIPIEIVIHNITADMLRKRFNVEEGKELDYPIIEYYLKNSANSELMINASHAVSFGLAKADELRLLDRQALKINAILKSLFARRDFKLMNVKIEFGRLKGKLILGDEISLDTCHLLDNLSGAKFNRDRILSDLGNSMTIYEEIKNRIMKKA